MTRYRAPEMSCDHEDGCYETSPDFYEGTADSVDGIKITISKRAPGWFSTLDADYCPEHLPGAAKEVPLNPAEWSPYRREETE